MNPTPLATTPTCIDLFGPIFLGKELFGNVLERLSKISEVVDPKNIFIFCGPPKNRKTVMLLLGISNFFEKTGLLPKRLIFSEKRPCENFEVVISSDLEYIANLKKRTVRVLIGCDPDSLKTFLEEVVFKAPSNEPPKWDTLLTIPDWSQNFNIILSWLKNPEQVLNVPTSKKI